MTWLPMPKNVSIRRHNPGSRRFYDFLTTECYEHTAVSTNGKTVLPVILSMSGTQALKPSAAGIMPCSVCRVASPKLGYMRRVPSKTDKLICWVENDVLT